MNDYEEIAKQVFAPPPASSTQPSQADNYEVVAGTLQAQRTQALEQSQAVASQTTPDNAAKIQALADKAKLPYDIVERHYEEIASTQRESLDYEDIIKKTPKTADWLSNPNNSRVSSDDVPNLQAMEKNIVKHSTALTLYENLNSGIYSLAKGVAQVPAFAWDASATIQNVAVDNLGLPEYRARFAPDSLRKNAVTDFLDEQANVWKTPELDKSIFDEVKKGNYRDAGFALANQIVANAPMQAALIAGTLAGYGIPALAGAGAVAGAEANAEAQSKVQSGEVSPEMATATAVTKGVIEAAFERLGTTGTLKHMMTQLEKTIGKEQAKVVMFEGIQQMTYGAVQEGKEEAATSIAQDLVDYISGVNPNALQGIDQRAIDAGLVGAGSGGGLTAPAAIASSLQKAGEARRTQMAKDFYLSMGQSAEAQKIRERLPEAQKSFVEGLVKDTAVENIFVPTEALDVLFQDQNPIKAMQDMGIAQAYEQAKEAGTDVKIPLSTWVSNVVGTPAYEGLADDVKFSPDSKSVNEVKAEREETARLLEQEANKAKEQAPAAATIEDQAAAIGGQIAEQLKAAGQDEQSAVIAESFFATLSQRYQDAGIDLSPQQLFDQYRLSVQGPNTTNVVQPGADTTNVVLNQPGDYEQLPVDIDEDGGMFEVNAEGGHASGQMLGENYGWQIAADGTEMPKKKSLKKVAEKYSNVWSLDSIQVENRADRGKGVGAQMLDSIIREAAAHEADAILLNASPMDGQPLSDLVDFYKSRGFKVIDQYEDQNATMILDMKKAPKTLFQSAPAQAKPFYSKLAQVIDEKIQGASATVQQVQGVIRDIKPEERKWSGIDEFLKGKEKVSKAELQEFLAANELQIQEVQKGGQHTADWQETRPGFWEKNGYTIEQKKKGKKQFYRLTDPNGQGMMDWNTLEAAKDDPAFEGDTAFKDTKFEKYTLPGGENYREVLFTLPEKQFTADALPDGFEFKTNKGHENNRWALWNNNSKEGGRLRPEIVGLGATKEAAIADYFRVNKAAGEGYRSSHWDEANVLAHVRLNDRTDADGKKVLFVEEIQSDLHQEGRKKGYRDRSQDTEIEKLKAEKNAILEDGTKSTDDRLALVKPIDEKIRQLSKAATEGVPDLPFRKNWHEFALKRIIRMAAEGGYDRVAWTTGEQQAERYSISKHVGEIRYNKSSRLTQVKTPDGYTIGAGDTRMSQDELAQTYGKEVAEKLLAQPATKNGWVELKGVDLKVGGEGMKAFYDGILVQFANKFGKKYGAKVGETKLDASREIEAKNTDSFDLSVDYNETTGNYLVIDPEGDMVESFSTEKDAEDYIDGKRQFQNSVQVHALDVTPELRNAALNEGFTLFQDGPQDPRGQIALMPNEAIIRLGKAADPSTFFHESAHYFFEFLTRLNVNENTPQTVKDDYQKLLKWLEVPEGQAPNTAQLEQFARGFEAYIMEGKAPSTGLKKAFATFKVWLTSVYRQLKGLDVQLNDEVRGVMDRLLATEEEIAAARLQSAESPFIHDAVVAGMSDKLATRYMKATLEARQFAEEEMTTALMRDLTRKQTAEYKAKRKEVREEMEKVVAARPNQRALAILQTGKLPDGSELPSDTPAIKLDPKSVQAVLEANGTPDLKLPRGVTNRKSGFPVGVVAEGMGYQSEGQFLSELAATKPFPVAVEEATEQMMRGLYPELLGAPQATEEAIKALHNEGRSEMLQLELEYLIEKAPGLFRDVVRKTVRRPPSIKAVRAQAQAMIGKQIVRDIRPAMYQRAEVKAAKLAGEALAKGDIHAAFDAKNRELLNHELYRAAVTARAELARAKPFFKKFFRKNDELAKSRDMDLVNAGRAILAEFGVGKTDKSAQEYLQPIQNYDQETYQTMLAIVDSATEGAGPVEEVTYDNFSAMNLALEAIWDLSKNIKTIEVDGKKVSQEKAIGEMQANISERLKAPDQAEYKKSADERDIFTRWLQSARAAFTRVESWTVLMDGGEQGAFHDYMLNPVFEGVTQYRLEKTKYVKKYLELVQPLKGTLSGEEILSPELKFKFKNKAQLLGMLLHTGNDSNKSKLLRGYGWGTVAEDGTLDTVKFDAFIARMQRDGVLTKADYDFVQSVWDLFEEMKPMAQKAHKSMYGFYFNEVTADEFSTPFGTYRGGYAPAKVDTFLSEDAALRSEKEQLERSNNSYAFPTAGRGATKTRVEAYAAPLQMDLGLVGSHIDWALRFAHIEPHVKSVSKMLWNKGFQQSLSALDPTVRSNMLIPWLQRTAQQSVETPSTTSFGRGLDAFCRTIRNRSSLNIMALNVVNTIEQYTGLSVAATKVAPHYLRDGLWSYLRDRKNVAESVTSKSDYMRTKVGESAREVQHTIDRLLLEPTKFEKAREFAESHGYFMQQSTQGVVDIVVWTGAYNQAIEKKLSEQEAVREADSIVRQTQGSGAPESVSRAETGTPFTRLFMSFYGYFNMQTNLLGVEGTFAREMGMRKGAGRGLYLYAMGFMIPAILGAALRKLAAGGFDEDDDEQYLDDFMEMFFLGQARAFFALLPGSTGQFAQRMVGLNKGYHDDKVSLSPAISAIEAVTSTPKSVYKAIAEEGSKKKAVKDVLNSIGTLTGYPTGAFGRPAGYLIDVNEGNANPTGLIDFTRGLVTGRSGSP